MHLCPKKQSLPQVVRYLGCLSRLEGHRSRNSCIKCSSSIYICIIRDLVWLLTMESRSYPSSRPSEVASLKILRMSFLSRWYIAYPLRELLNCLSSLCAHCWVIAKKTCSHIQTNTSSNFAFLYFLYSYTVFLIQTEINFILCSDLCYVMCFFYMVIICYLMLYYLL